MRTRDDESVVRTALERGLVTSQEIESCRRSQAELRARGQEAFLSQILLRKGLLDSATLQGILRESKEEPPRPFREPRYRIEATLGEGAMAVVHRAYDRELNRHVALKILKRTGRLHKNADKRFQREAMAVAKLSHPNVVTVYDVREEDGELSLVMELVQGESLDRVFARGRPRANELARLIEKVARGVDHAHAAGIVHRDLKPSNILVAESGEPKVVDFGLAHLSDSDSTALTQSGARLGTPLYMAPEQVDGRAEGISPRTDVYALGAILYEGLAGRPPHQGDSATEVYGKIAREDPVPPSRLRRGVPRDLETVVLLALEKEPRRRYRGAGELADELVRFLAGEPVRARPRGSLDRLRRLLARRRGPIFAAFVALLAAGVAFALARAGERRSPEAATPQAEERVSGSEARLALLERMRPVEGAIQEARPFLYVKSADIRARIQRVELALADLSELSSRPEHAASAELWALLGMGWYFAGDSRAAWTALEKARELGPSDGRVEWCLGRISLERSMVSLLSTAADRRRGHRRDQAERWAREALEHIERAGDGWSGASDLDFLVARAYHALAQANESECLSIATRALERFDGEPGSEEFWNLRGWIEGAADRARQVELYDRAIEIRPHYAWGFFMRGAARQSQRDLQGAIADFDRAIEENPRLGPALSNRGLCRLSVCDFGGALADLDLAVAGDPSFAEALVNRGLARGRAGDVEGAAADFDRALEIDPALAEAHNNRGLLLLRQDRREEALADYDAAIGLDPDYAEPYANRASLFVGSDRREEALARCDAAIAADPDRAPLYMERGMLRRSAGDATGALADLDAALARDPELAPAYAERGTIRYALGDREGALADYNQAIELAPRHPGAWTNRGILKMENGDLDGAFSDYERALALDPAQAAAYTNRGSVEMLRGELELALADFGRAIQLEPGAPEPYASRALVHRARGDWAAAAQDLETALEVAPPDWPHRESARQVLEEARRMMRGG
ncbi:MAG: tetratricopeptide repeat protein [Planctomycetes bacterium]|nr:tetratricopeptide repeat protein [Planctomycetota bacterium]